MAIRDQMTENSNPDFRLLQESLYGIAAAAEVRYFVFSRRLEDRIRDLCSQVVSAKETELEPLISDLQAALHEHNARLRKLAAAKLARLPMSFRKTLIP